MRSGLALVCVVGCNTGGSLDITLELPTNDNLRPSGMTSITVLATAADVALANTSPYDGGAFSAGELPYADDVQIAIELHDESDRLVGIGRARELLDLTKDGARTTIAVRRPFVYGATGTGLYAYDSTRDNADPQFQQAIGGVVPTHVTTLGAGFVVAANGRRISVVDTATHTPIGPPIMLLAATAISDLAQVGSRPIVAVAHEAGISIVNVDTGEVFDALVGPVDQVTVGVGSDGRVIAYGLVGRVAPPATPYAACAGTSSLVAVAVDDPSITASMRLLVPVASIAASPTTAALFGAAPCTDQIVKFDGDLISTGTAVATPIAGLDNAALVAVSGDRLWAAGTAPSAPKCTPTACVPQTTAECPVATMGNRVSYVPLGARLIVTSIPIGDGATTRIVMPEHKHVYIDGDDAAQAHSQTLTPLGVVPVDFVVLPDRERVSIVTQSNYYIETLNDGVNNPILPCLKSTVDEWSIVDIASGTVAQRITTQCTLIHGAGALFPSWSCAPPPEGESPGAAEYVLTSVTALLGAG